MRTVFLGLVLAVCVSNMLSATVIARAAILDTVNWAPDASVDGTGTGVLAGSNTVSYTTAVGFNAGVTYNETWVTDLGTAGATGGGVTYQLGGVLGGAAGAGTTETIAFSSAVVNPVLLVNFLGYGGRNANDAFNFGSTGFNLLSSNNAVYSSPNKMLGVNDTDSANDGFGIQLLGTFGPSNPLVFNYSSDGTGPNGLQSVAFTLGVPLSQSVPEPSTFIVWSLLGSLAVGIGGWWKR